MTTSFYVRRDYRGRPGWTGPIRSERQARKEAAAWNDAGWSAVVEPSTATIRAEVRAWTKASNARHGR